MPQNIIKDKNLYKILDPVSSHFDKGHLWDMAMSHKIMGHFWDIKLGEKVIGL
jgi:hypothetical protein